MALVLSCRKIVRYFAARAFVGHCGKGHAKHSKAIGKTCGKGHAKTRAPKSGSEKAKRQNAAKACRAEQKTDPAAFKAKYGTNGNGHNAFGKCVSSKAKSSHSPSGGSSSGEGSGSSSDTPGSGSSGTETPDPAEAPEPAEAPDTSGDASASETS